ncbi:hypothetical protein DMH18_26735 [Streptomyces sp. WAC 06783]|uniref:DUF742 domain-containing protein n=1 Tax=Streptomyces sp. WAC 06783 TaxID=2203211 RepID=UPI000F73A2E7|nr:DUF742 domain-containing protein [Streptomyces sp. WAC 06783]RSO07032.1 hypothetical protein DMH18_26735 [Streptomyces sp. WAC 06783]
MSQVPDPRDVPDRSFVALRGRISSDHALDPSSLVLTQRMDVAGLQMEDIRIIELCSDRALAVVEIAALLRRPLGFVTVVLSRLIDQHRVFVHHSPASPPAQSRADADDFFGSPQGRELLERVLGGLRRI